MIYLASPYSHPAKRVRARRYEEAVWAAGSLIVRRGEAVFSPIAHSHPIAEAARLDGTFSGVWAEMDLAIIAICSEVVVLRLAGWEESKGIAAEIAEAQRLGIPVTYQ